MGIRFLRRILVVGLALTIVLSMNAAFAGANIVPMTRLGYWTQPITMSDLYPDGTPTPVPSPTVVDEGAALPDSEPAIAEPASPDATTTAEILPTATEVPLPGITPTTEAMPTATTEPASATTPTTQPPSKSTEYPLSTSTPVATLP